MKIVEQHDLKTDYFVMSIRVGSDTFGAYLKNWSTLSLNEQRAARKELRAQLKQNMHAGPDASQV